MLRHVSFTVPAGGTLAVVGATGSGKSALIDLIPRMYDPQEGEILIDGVPLRELSLSELRGEIGYVPQESFLFSDTIASNLAYGDAAHSLMERAADGETLAAESRATGEQDAESHAWAADVAQLDETVHEFPHGYGTMLGERGINLSGGQKQRLALARARSRGVRASCCSTTRCRQSTRTPKRRSCARCAKRWRGERRSSRRTGSARYATRRGSSCSIGGAWWNRARTTC